MNIRAWLRKQPQPFKLRVDSKDVALPEGKWKWADAERTIGAMNGSKVECLDNAGGVLRACVLGDDGETEDTKAASSPKESELVLIARELRIAADEASQRHEAAYRYAFDAIVSMFTAQSGRLASLETAWQKMVLAAAAPQGEDAGLLETLLGGVVQGRAERAAEAAAASNGKKK